MAAERRRAASVTISRSASTKRAKVSTQPSAHGLTLKARCAGNGLLAKVAEKQPACWPASDLGLSRLPSFALEEVSSINTVPSHAQLTSAAQSRSAHVVIFAQAEAWLMNDDAAVESLFAVDSWVCPLPVLADTQPEPEQRSSGRRCKVQSATSSVAPVCGRQVKVWFENRRCSEKRMRLGVKARRLRIKP